MENTSMKGEAGMSGMMERDQEIPSPGCVMRPTQDLLLLPSRSESAASTDAPASRTQPGQLNANFHVLAPTFH